VNSVDSVGLVVLVNREVVVGQTNEVDPVGIVEDNLNSYSIVIYVRGLLKA
jgi:hypothetical protein|tara:strand:- start:703 stop:855 length:153 start_codon:yes stop_codon:yes gene_type:complete